MRIETWLYCTKIMNNLSTIASDINGHQCPITLFKSRRPNEAIAKMYRSRPDIIQEENCITVVELTCRLETNLLKLHNYKITKYQNLCSALSNTCSHFKLILLEISYLSFNWSSIKTFKTNLNEKKTLLNVLYKKE